MRQVLSKNTIRLLEVPGRPLGFQLITASWHPTQLTHSHNVFERSEALVLMSDALEGT